MANTIRVYFNNTLATQNTIPYIGLYEAISYLFFQGGKVALYFDAQKGFYLEVKDTEEILFGRKPLVISDLIDTSFVVKVTTIFSIREYVAPITAVGDYLWNENVVLSTEEEQTINFKRMRYFLKVDSIDEFNEVIQAFWNGDLVHRETKKTTLELLKENNSELNKKMESLNNENRDLREQLTKYTTTIFYKSWVVFEHIFIPALKKGLEKLKNVKFSRRK